MDKLLMEKLDWKRHHRRPRPRRDYNIKTDLKTNKLGERGLDYSG